MKNVIVSLVTAALCITLLAGCGATATPPETPAATEVLAVSEPPAVSEAPPVSEAPAVIEAPEDDGVPLEGTADAAGFTVADLGESVTFHTELQQEALTAGYKLISQYSNGGMDEYSIPAGITLRWSYINDTQPDTFTVTLSTQADLSDSIVFEAEGHKAVCSGTAQNLFLGTTYYYSISAGDDVSDVYSFTTSSEGPRNLYVDGVTNVRDIGGWATLDGGVVRQGLAYRCGQLNLHESTTPCITEAGIDTMLNVLGVITEIDFRRTDDNEYGGITESPLGASVSYYSLPVGRITDISPDIESIKTAFRLLVDENNYPLIYHCKIGTDRTGLFSYLLLGLLNVSREDLYTDYTFSNLATIEGRRDYDRLDKMLKDNFEAYLGATPNETSRNCLKSLGFTDVELDKVVSIMVEK